MATGAAHSLPLPTPTVIRLRKNPSRVATRRLRSLWVAIALVSSPARADDNDDVTVSLEWSSTEGCLDTESLRTSVSARTRRKPVAAGEGADAVIVGRAEPGPKGGWWVELRVTDRAGAELGRRTLEIAEGGCAPLRDHVAVITAMLVDSSVVEQAAQTAPVVPPPPRPPPPRPPPRVPSPPWRGTAAVFAAGEVGRLPDVKAGGGLTIGRGFGAIARVDLTVTRFAAATARSDDGGRTVLRWTATALDLCTAWRAGRLLLTDCAGLEAGLVSARGSGFADNSQNVELLVDGRLVIQVDLDLVGPVFLRAGVVGRAALVRPRFGFEDETGVFQPLYQPSFFAATGHLGLGARFP